MIEGRINSRRQAKVRIEVRGPTRLRRRISALVDTGYDGFLTLPQTVIDELLLPWEGYRWSMLADDSEVQSNVYPAAVHWDGRWRSILVESSGSTPLLGMQLMDGYELRLQARIGGRFTIELMT